MITALDAPAGALDPHEQNFVEKIRTHGWFQTGVGGDTDNPPFSYTTGFGPSVNAPELIVFSLHPEIAHSLFWEVFRAYKAGRDFLSEQRAQDLIQNGDLVFLPVAKRHYAAHLGWSRWFYGGDVFACLQMIWPDRAGLFPWERGCDEQCIASQPDRTDQGWHCLGI